MKNSLEQVEYLTSLFFSGVGAGITQSRIDECRGAKEATMLADIQALVQNGADLNAHDDNGTTLVRRED